MDKKLNLLFVFLLMVVVIGGGFYLFRHKIGSQPKFSTEKADVTSIDTAPALSGITPEGFPDGFPVNAGAIIDQHRIDYPEKGATLYTLSYRSSRSYSDLYDQYEKYFRDQGYFVQQSFKYASSSSASITAAKDSATISVAISPATGYALVKIASLHKK